jgi:hypothetical protein
LTLEWGHHQMLPFGILMRPENSDVGDVGYYAKVTD